MSVPSVIGVAGLATGFVIVVVGLIANVRRVSRHGEPSLTGLRLQVIGFAVVILAFGVDILIAAGSTGAPAAVAPGVLVVLAGVGALYLATRLRVRQGPKDP